MKTIIIKALLSIVFLIYTTLRSYSAELVNASWSASSNIISATSTYTFSYQAVTANPYYAFSAIFPPGFSCAGISDVIITVDGNAAALSGASSVSGAVVQLSLSNTSLVTAGSNIVVTALITNASSTGTKYWSYIRTANNLGTMIDEISAPAPIILLPPVPNAPVATFTSSVGANTFKAFWSTPANATGYRLDLSTISDFSTLVTGYNDLSIGNTFSITLTGLSPGTTYYYRLRATNVSGTSGNSNSLSVTTSKAAASVILTGLSKTCDGSPKQATANTSPAGLAMTYTYNGSSTPPSNAGSYAVVGTVNDPAYMGTASGTLVISKGTASVLLINLNQGYDGSAKAAFVTTIPAGLAVDFTYDGSSVAPTEMGTYAVTATVNDANYQGNVSGTLVISQGSASVSLAGLASVYDGTAKPVTANTILLGLPTVITYNGSSAVPVNAGTYTIVATVSDSHYTGSASGTLVISKATASVSLANLSVVYNGSAKAVTAATMPSGLTVSITYDGSSAVPVGAGTYAIIATVNDVNYQGSVSGTLVISKADAFITLSDLTAQYDGACKSASISTAPTNLTVDITYDGSSAAPAASGTYQVVATIDHPNYKGTTSGYLTISKITGTIGQISGEVRIYPNPSSDFVKVEASSTIKNIQMVDFSGAVVATKESSSVNEVLDVRELKKGTYVLVVESALGKGYYRIVLN